MGVKKAEDYLIMTNEEYIKNINIEIQSLTENLALRKIYIYVDRIKREYTGQQIGQN